MHSSKINALVHDFTRDSNLMLARITCRAFSTCLRANLNSRAVKCMQARAYLVSRGQTAYFYRALSLAV